MRENPDGTIRQIEELEARYFPRTFDEHKQALGSTPNRPNCYSFFAPSHHFETGLMTEGIVDDLVDNPDKKMLSIGSGPAYLEQILVKLGIQPQQITLSDIDPCRVNGPLANRYISFNMLEQWPRFKNRFAYVIFPESFPGLPIPTGGERITQRTKNLVFVVQQALSVLKPGGEIRLSHYTERNAQTIISTIRSWSDVAQASHNNGLVVVRKR